MNEEILSKSVVWQHLEIQRSLALLQEWGIGLNEALMKEKNISIGQLLFFKIKDFEKLFGIEKKESFSIAKKLEPRKKEFKQFLKKNQVLPL